jgi:hypothetical protein
MSVTEPAYHSLSVLHAWIARDREPDPELYTLGQSPTPEDLKRLPPLAGYVRINTIENVHRFTIHHPKEKPSDEIRRTILDRQQLEHERANAPQPPPQKKHTAEKPAAQPPPQNPDDFSF